MSLSSKFRFGGGGAGAASGVSGIGSGSGGATSGGRVEGVKQTASTSNTTNNTPSAPPPKPRPSLPHSRASEPVLPFSLRASTSLIPTKRASPQSSLPAKRQSLTPQPQVATQFSPEEATSDEEEGADENLDPLFGDGGGGGGGKKARISVDSGFAEEVKVAKGAGDVKMEVGAAEEDVEDDEKENRFAMEGILRYDGNGGESAIVRDSISEGGSGIRGSSSGASSRASWMPPPPEADHLDEIALDTLKNDLADYQERRISILEQLSEIWKRGGGKSSEGNDAGYLEHNKAYLDERVSELKAEIHVRGHPGLPINNAAPEIPGSIPRSTQQQPHLSNFRPSTSYASSSSSSSSRSVTAPHPPIVQPPLASTSKYSSSSSSSVGGVASPHFRPATIPSISREPANIPPVASTSKKPSAFRPSSITGPPPTSSKGKGKSPVPPVVPEYMLADIDFDDTSVFTQGPSDLPQQPPAEHQQSRKPSPPLPPPSKVKVKELSIDLDSDSDDNRPLLRQKPPKPKSNAIVIESDDDDEDRPLAQTIPSRQPPPPTKAKPPPPSPAPKSTSVYRSTAAPDGLPPIQKFTISRHPWSKDVDKALRQRFGLVGFRNNQLAAIDGTLSGRDVFVLLPTGGGKSLCYQLPAVISTGKTKGVTVVISPLLSLIEDQCKSLVNKDIPVVSVSGTMPMEDKKHAMSCLRASPPDCVMVYLTPEQIVNSNLMRDVLFALYKKGWLARFVLDEAHCLSSWGHDFRPDYKAMSCLKKDFPGIPLMALTATASLRVRKDVMDNLGMSNAVVLTASFNRPNLKYEVRPKNKGILGDIVAFITGKHKGQCGIIYCFSQKQCEDVAMKLREQKINARHYHAGMPANDRSRIQQGWQNDDFQVICATIAFGMGIDKPDVRYVIHYSLPKNLEGYYQETGRAGRDGKTSVCLLFYAYGDTASLYNHIRESDATPDQKDHNRECLRLVVQYCLNLTDCRRRQVLQYFGEAFKAEDCHKSCDNCLKVGTQAKQDVTDDAQNAIQLVKSFGARNRVTLLTAVDIFRGSKSQKIVAKGYTDLEHHGSGSNISRGDAERLFQILSSEGVFSEHLERSSLGYTHAYIQMGAKANDVLKGKKTIMMDMADPKGAATAKGKEKSHANSGDYDDEEDEEEGQPPASWNPLGRKVTQVQLATPSAPLAAEDLEQNCFSELSECRDEVALDCDCEPNQVISGEALQSIACLLPLSMEDYFNIEGCEDEEIYDVFFITGGAKAVVRKYAALRNGAPPPTAAPARATSACPPPSTGKAPTSKASTSKASTSKVIPTPKTTAKAPVRRATSAPAPKKTKSVTAAKPKAGAPKMTLDRFLYPGAGAGFSTSGSKSGGIKAMPFKK